MIGYEDDELENSFEEWSLRMHPDDLQITLDILSEAQKFGAQLYEATYRFRHKDGSWIWILDRGQTIFDENKKAIRMVGFHTDITKERRANKEIKRVLSAFERSEISVVMTDLDATIEYVNPSWCKVTGYSKEELIGQNPKIVKSSDTPKELYKKMWRHLKYGKVFNVEMKNITKDGVEFWEDSTIIPSFDYRGKIDGYISFKLNIDEKIKLKKEIFNKEEMIIAQSRHAAMGEMISMIAHQWRQPISVIAMDANNILADIELEMVEEDLLKENLEDIILQTRELSKTIDDFRNFFRPDKLTTEVAIKDIIDDTIEVLSKSLINNGINIKIDIEENYQIKTFSRELMQVLINILKNAKEELIESKIENKEITIKSEVVTNGLKIYIYDNANGIDENILDKIFNPYFSTKTEKNGTGLGLYMSKTIVEKHLKGHIKAYNKDRGACFEILLPNDIENA
jgi:PAS domain S-box-containing protein